MGKLPLGGQGWQGELLLESQGGEGGLHRDARAGSEGCHWETRGRDGVAPGRPVQGGLGCGAEEVITFRSGGSLGIHQTSPIPKE